MKDLAFAVMMAMFAGGLLLEPTAIRAQAERSSNELTLAGLKQLSLEELANIKVTTEAKQPVKLLESPAAIYVITGDDIRRSGVTTIVDALRLAPGVEVARIDGNEWAVGIRGFGTRLSRSVLVMIDGRSVYAQLFAGTYWEVQDTLLQDIDRIEVIRGPGGTIWGPNAVNGVINIITKNTKLTQGTLASTAGGNLEHGLFDFQYGGGFGASSNYRTYLKGFNRGPEFHPDGNNFDRWRSLQAGFRIDWTNNSNHTVTVQGDAYDMRAGESLVANTYLPPFAQVLNQNGRFSGGNVMTHWTRTFKNASDIQFQAYYDRTNHWEPNFAELRNTVDLDFVHHLPAFSRQTLTWGLGARFSPSDTSEVVSGLVFDPANRVDQLHSGFAQDQIGIVPNRLMLTVGSKFLHTNFTRFGAEPSARLLWAVTNRQIVWTAATHALRTPSRAETDMQLLGFAGTSNGLPFFGRFTGNKNFQPEQLNGYEFGYRNAFSSKVSLDTTAFYNHYHGLLGQNISGPIFTEDTPSPKHLIIPGGFINLVRGNVKGAEIAGDWKPASIWRLKGSYSYLHMSLTQPAGSLDTSTSRSTDGSSPQHQVVAESLVDLPKQFELNAIVRYVGALPAQGIPAYTTGDANVVWRWRRSLDISLVGQNLLQPHHPEFRGNPGPLTGVGRSVYARITWTHE